MNDVVTRRDELIETLRLQGCNLIELKPKSKIPSKPWKQYQSEINDDVIGRDSNYAVIGGSISKDLVIIDVDH